MKKKKTIEVISVISREWTLMCECLPRVRELKEGQIIKIYIIKNFCVRKF